jgi:Tfp pilus assembly protein PilF
LKAGTPEIKQAQALLEKAVSLDPKLAEAHVQLGALYMARGEAARAIASYQMAVTSKPMLPEAHYRLALAYKRNGENAKAEREFQLYRETQHAETAAVEARRRELRQFLVILKGEPGAPH